MAVTHSDGNHGPCSTYIETATTGLNPLEAGGLELKR